MWLFKWQSTKTANAFFRMTMKPTLIKNTIVHHQDIILGADLQKTCGLCRSPDICTIRFAELCIFGYLRRIDTRRFVLIRIFGSLWMQISEDIYPYIFPNIYAA